MSVGAPLRRVAALALALGCGPDPAASGAAAPACPGRVLGGPYATRVVSFRPGEGATFGHDQMPCVVLGPPQGAGSLRGGVDVVSLGLGGEILVALDDVAIVDGPGVDFLVFENAFEVSGAEGRSWDELAEVAVSDDGVDFRTFPCARAQRPYHGCAGWNPVHATATNGLATDPARAGGDPFDLAVVGLRRARFVRLRDLRTQGSMPPASGFDLDAVAVVHGVALR